MVQPEAPLVRMSTAQQVAGALRDQILRGRFAPGSRIPEDEVAIALQVSRNSIREGLQILVSEGLVQRSLHRGAVVGELTTEERSDVYQARRVIETASLRNGMRNLDAFVDGIVRCLDEMHEAVMADDVPAMLEADRRFHEAIVAASASERVSRFYRNLQTEIRLTRTWHGERQPSPVFFARHKEVVDAIQTGDLQAAEGLLVALIDDGEQRVRTSLKGAVITDIRASEVRDQ